MILNEHSFSKRLRRLLRKRAGRRDHHQQGCGSACGSFKTCRIPNLL